MREVASESVTRGALSEADGRIALAQEEAALLEQAMRSEAWQLLDRKLREKARQEWTRLLTSGPEETMMVRGRLEMIAWIRHLAGMAKAEAAMTAAALGGTPEEE